MSREESLVTTDWAEQNLSTPGLVFVEVDEDTDAYDAGHIPGAISINWSTELRYPVRRDFIDRPAREAARPRACRTTTAIVLYSGNNNWFATYAYWLFALRGVENVKLLDGGRKKWELEACR